MNTKLSLHTFWSCHENGLIKTIQMIPVQPISEFQVDFPLLWIKDYPGLSKAAIKGSRLETHI